MKLFSIKKFADGTSLRSGLHITAEHFDYCFSRLKPGVYEVRKFRKHGRHARAVSIMPVLPRRTKSAK